MMNSEYSERAARELWQSQAVQPKQFSIEELERLHRYFNSKIRRRNAREYLAGLLVFVAFGYMGLRAPTWDTRLGAALTVIGGAYVLWHLHRHGSARSTRADNAARACRDYYRADLERQHRLLASVARWYIAPFVPGYVLLQVAQVRLRGTLDARLAFSIGVGALVTMSVLWLNARAAAELARRIRALDELDTPNES